MMVWFAEWLKKSTLRTRGSWHHSKLQTKNYVDQVVTLSIDCYGADLSKFHRVRSVKKINFFNFLKIKEQDIIDIIKNKDYD